MPRSWSKEAPFPGPVADLERIPLAAHDFSMDAKDRLFFSSAAQVAVQNVTKPYSYRGYSTARFLSRTLTTRRRVIRPQAPAAADSAFRPATK
jgi:hypothetical protein